MSPICCFARSPPTSGTRAACSATGACAGTSAAPWDSNRGGRAAGSARPLRRGGAPLTCTQGIPEAALAAIRERTSGKPMGDLAWEADGTRYLSGYGEIFLRGRFGADAWSVIASQPAEHVLRRAAELVPSDQCFLLRAEADGSYRLYSRNGPGGNEARTIGIAADRARGLLEATDGMAGPPGAPGAAPVRLPA